MNIHEDIKAYLDNELNTEDARRLEEALQNDPLAQEHLAHLKAIAHGLRLVEAEATVKGKAALLDRLATKKKFYNNPKFLALAGVAASLLIGCFFLGNLSLRDADNSEPLQYKLLAPAAKVEASPDASPTYKRAPAIRPTSAAKAMPDSAKFDKRGGSEAENLSAPEDQIQYYVQPETPAQSRSLQPSVGSAAVSNTPYLTKTDISLDVEVQDVSEASSKASNIAKDLGGFTSHLDANSSHANMSLTVPHDKVDAALEDLKRLGSLLQLTVDNTPLSGAYQNNADEEARLKESIAELRKLVNQTNKPYQREQFLSEINEKLQELDNFKHANSGIKSAARMSTIQLALEKASKPVTPPKTKSEIEQTIEDMTTGFKMVLFKVFKGLTYLAIASPVWVPLVLLGMWLARASRNKSNF